MIPLVKSHSGGPVTTTLLAVDDSRTMRKVLEITFAGEDYRTVLAESSGAALTKLAAEKPAVALVDAHLGADSGYELCQAIKRQSPGVPVIILSSKQQPYDRARGTSVGADDFMDKPFDTQQLIDKVAAVLRRVSEAPAPPPVAARPAVQPPPAAAVVQPRPPAHVPAHTLAFGAVPAAQRAGAAQRPPAPAAAPGARPPVPSAPRRPIAPTPVSGTPAQAPQRAAAPVSGGTQPSMLSAGVPASRPAAAPAARPAPAAPAPAARAAAASPPAQAPARPPVAGVAAASPPAAQAAARPEQAAAAVQLSGELKARLQALGLTADQISGVLALSREVVEKVVWEVVPVLAETMIEEEIKRLTRE
jgi:CheY-like chemotaxis protein